MKVLVASNHSCTGYFAYFISHELFRVQEHFSDNKKSSYQQLLGGIEVSYTPVAIYSSNIFIIIHALNFASDLGNN